ncbi:hypothetical protein NMY22_g19209 [Coprinellus aureogranulatus]|nr:hypothetical protein NMY22_g19209 [Coprinellus aureogranulatus]
MTEYLKSYFEKHFQLRPVDFTYGDSLSGSLRLRTSLSYFLNSHFGPHTPVTPAEPMTSSGLLPMISSLGRALVDPGNAVIIAAPYYHGFDIALGTLDSIRIIGVSTPFSEALTQSELDRMELALQDAECSGTKVQALSLVNPQNPYGRCYTHDILEGYARFAEQHDLHLVSDEVYALSTFNSRDIPSPKPFISILSIDLDKLKVRQERVHMLYGMSKDFDANGFRAGMLHTRNRGLYQSLLATSIFSIVSSPTAELWSSLLEDEVGLRTYIERNREELRGAYEHLTDWLKFHGIPYIPSAAGHFLMADFRSVLSKPSILQTLDLDPEKGDMCQRELALLAHLCAEPCKVVFGSGSGFHMPEPGWFRLTFSIPRLALDTSLRRVEKVLGWNVWPELRSKQLEEGSWKDANEERSLNDVS